MLRAFVRFAHAESGIEDRLTDETLAAIDDWEPDYQELIRTPRPQGPNALVARDGRAGAELMGEQRRVQAPLLS